MNILLKMVQPHRIVVGGDVDGIRLLYERADYKNTIVNPTDVPVAVYGSHVENSKVMLQ